MHYTFEGSLSNSNTTNKHFLKHPVQGLLNRMTKQRLPVLQDSDKTAKNVSKKRLPAWFNIKLPNAKQQAKFNETKASVKDNKLHTVCEEAKCPNIHD